MSHPSIATTWSGFKEMAAEFFRTISDANLTQEEADNGFKCLGLAYLGMEGTELELHQASILLEIAANKMIQYGFAG